MIYLWLKPQAILFYPSRIERKSTVRITEITELNIIENPACLAIARIELAGYAYTYNNISHKAVSCELRNTNDWTRLEVELDSGEQAYLMPYLFLEGTGTAWFDDVMLEKISLSSHRMTD